MQTTDFFYPLVDDPYVQGRIAAANVLSDLYAMGVADCDNMLMLLSLSLDMSEKQRLAVTPLLMRGFADMCAEAGTSVNGGQTVKNPWVIVGGVASAVCTDAEYVLPTGGKAGDVLVLSKPLGTQLAVNAHQWLSRPDRLARISEFISPAEILHTYRMAMRSMAQLNRNGARLMHKYGVHGATDVTGFGLIGHARNLAEFQTDSVDLVIDTLPVLKSTALIDSKVSFRLTEGLSAETSGGLLMMVPPENVDALRAELEALDGLPTWIIGRVVEGSRTATLTPDLKIVEVEIPEMY